MAESVLVPLVEDYLAPEVVRSAMLAYLREVITSLDSSRLGYVDATSVALTGDGHIKHSALGERLVAQLEALYPEVCLDPEWSACAGLVMAMGGHFLLWHRLSMADSNRLVLCPETLQHWVSQPQRGGTPRQCVATLQALVE